MANMIVSKINDGYVVAVKMKSFATACYLISMLSGYEHFSFDVSKVEIINNFDSEGEQENVTVEILVTGHQTAGYIEGYIQASWMANSKNFA